MNGFKALLGIACAGGLTLAGVVGYDRWLAPSESVLSGATHSASASPDVVEPAAVETPDTTRLEKTRTARIAEPAAINPEQTPPAAEPPRFDVVRIDRDGGSLVAGSSAPKENVLLRLDGAEVGKVPADAGGNFVAMLDLGAAEVPRVLSIETRDATGAASPARETILIAPSRPAAPEVPPTPVVAEARTGVDQRDTATGGRTPAAPAPGTPSSLDLATPMPDARPSASAGQIAALVTAAVPDEVPEPVPAPVAAESATPPPATNTPDPADVAPATPPRLFRTGPDGLALLPLPDPGKLADPALGIAAISYDAAGEVSLAGTGRADETLRIYLDDAPVALARVGQGGTWSSPLPNVDNGVYTLRIDALAEDGTVLRRIETPFQRTAPDIATAVRGDGATAVTVQPGYTLWAISEGYYGEGVRYVQIFERNRDQISDPDLIYPGQMLDLPGKG